MNMNSYIQQWVSGEIMINSQKCLGTKTFDYM